MLTIFERRKFSTCISVQNQTDFLCHLIKGYLFSVSIYAFRVLFTRPT